MAGVSIECQGSGRMSYQFYWFGSVKKSPRRNLSVSKQGRRHFKPKNAGEQTQKYEEVVISKKLRFEKKTFLTLTWWMNKRDVGWEADRVLGLFE